MSVAFSDVTLTIEIGFDSDPLDTSQTFTDISATYAKFIDQEDNTILQIIRLEQQLF